jgi:4-hydroxybenzoate polyprenyltransferase
MILKFLRLIRLPNLIIIALSQLLIRNCLIMPAYTASYFATEIFPQHLSALNFTLLVISTVLIAAAGYIINDTFDVHIDEVNKPGKNIIGKNISESTAKKLYFILSGTGIVIGFYLAIQIGKPVMGLVHVFSAVSLWMYSAHFKRRLLSGNLIISILCALSLLIVGLYEPEFYSNINFLLWFAIPAFLLSFIRELIKDIEDIDGDERSQCKTAPIVWGIRATKGIIIFLIVVLMLFLSDILYFNFYTNTVIGFWYLESIFIIPILGLLYLVISAGEKRDYYFASLFSKILMLLGVLMLIPFWYYFLK